MAGLIKKQILKHLSKFAKNLSADKINLSTFRGEGELSNLELDCIALQNVMNLPTWLQINHATCNKVHVKIPWTKLTSTPISIFLDAVQVDMITCEKPREPNGPSPIQASASSGETSYGFTEKVLEGMAVSINSISVNFTSAAFNANFQLSQLLVLSTNPKWESTDLKDSRIQDKTLGQVLTFKKLSWQTMRIVANAVTSGDKSITTPLRLITNQSEIRMTFRRKTSDCSILASRLHIYFDDLLWVLTDSQVQSALLCVKSLRDTIERSSQQMRELGLDKSQEPNQPPAQPVDVVNDLKDDQFTSKLFFKHTVIESSLHLDFNRVDLHICEESSPLHKASTHAGVQGGAIQISLQSLKIDHYPYHKPASDRHHFRDYGETMAERDSWSQGIVKQFRRDFAVLTKAAGAKGNLKTATGKKKHSRLVENCLILRLADIDIHQVTTSNSRKLTTGRLVNSTRKDLHLPEDMPLFYFIRTEYFYPDGRDFPAPHDNIFMQVNAPQIHAHWDSLIWLNRLSTVTVQAVQVMLEDLGILSDSDDVGDTVGGISHSQSTAMKEEEHADIRIQVLMPKIFVPGDASTHMDQPHGLEIQASKAAITNCREGTDCSRMHLKNVLNKIEKQYLAKNGSAFPNEGDVDLAHSQELFKSHAKGNDNPLSVTLRGKNPSQTRNALIASAANDVWSVDLENVWIDFVMPSEKRHEVQPTGGGFLGLSKGSNDLIASSCRAPFIDSFPAQLWIGKASGSGTAKLETAVPSKSPVLSPTNSVLNVDSPVIENLWISKQSSVDADHSKVNRDEAALPSPSLKPSASLPSLEPNERRTSGPRSLRNKKLLEYYSRPSPSEENLSKDQSAVPQDRVSEASTSSAKSKVIATYIMLQTDKSLRLQLDHHQYLYLLRLIDKLEDVGNQLEDSSEEALQSFSSSASSTPSYSTKSHHDISYRPTQKKSKPFNTTSIRISAPSADLFLILRPPPPNVRADENGTCKSVASEETRETISVVKDIEPSDEHSVQVDKSTTIAGSKVTMGKTLLKFPPGAQDTPPISECSSDTTSVQDFDNLSMFGDSFPSHAGTYVHVELDAVENSPRSNSFSLSHPLGVSENGDALLVQRDQNSASDFDGSDSPAEVHVKEKSPLLSEEKSGSLLVLSTTDTTLTSKAADRTLLCNLSSDDLAAPTPKSVQQFGIVNAAASKCSSSGYESGSYESLPLPCPTDAERCSSPHSHSSSDASDQFCMIQVDEKGKGLEEFSAVRLLRKGKTSSISSGHVSETSSLSSQSLPAGEQQAPSAADLAEDTLATCGMADSQITVTNVETASLSSTSDKESQTLAAEQKKEAENEMSSQALLHISGGMELAVDSNDAGDAVVKIVAAVVDVLELGARDGKKKNSLFADYSIKKCESLLKQLGDTRSREGTPDACLRVDSGPLAGRFSPAAVKEGNIQLTADGVHLGLKSSTLANLGAFLEDEEIPKIVPMKIEATDVKLTIEDDMPPAYEATPRPEPMTLHVHSATVKRTDDGTFHVITSSTSGENVTSPPKEDMLMLSRAEETNLANASAADAVPSQNVTATDASMENRSSDGTNDASSEKYIASNRNENNSKPEHEDDRISRMQRVIDDLTQKLHEVETERDCLSEALKLMQEDLIQSEQERENLRASINL